MKTYLTTIKYLQKYLLWISLIIFLLIMPSAMVFLPDLMDWWSLKIFLFNLSLGTATFVMAIRPLADIFRGVKFIRPLVILRKGFGVLSASIIFGFFLSKVIASGGAYFSEILKEEYWSWEKYKILAHLGDMTAFILLITSNKFSKNILGKWWKRIQKLAYVYFYSGALYEYLVFQQEMALWAIILVSILVFGAFIKNRKRRNNL